MWNPLILYTWINGLWLVLGSFWWLLLSSDAIDWHRACLCLRTWIAVAFPTYGSVLVACRWLERCFCRWWVALRFVGLRDGGFWIIVWSHVDAGVPSRWRVANEWCISSLNNAASVRPSSSTERSFSNGRQGPLLLLYHSLTPALFYLALPPASRGPLQLATSHSEVPHLLSLLSSSILQPHLRA